MALCSVRGQEYQSRSLGSIIICAHASSCESFVNQMPRCPYIALAWEYLAWACHRWASVAAAEVSRLHSYAWMLAVAQQLA